MLELGHRAPPTAALGLVSWLLGLALIGSWVFIASPVAGGGWRGFVGRGGTAVQLPYAAQFPLVFEESFRLMALVALRRWVIWGPIVAALGGAVASSATAPEAIDPWIGVKMVVSAVCMIPTLSVVQLASRTRDTRLGILRWLAAGVEASGLIVLIGVNLSSVAFGGARLVVGAAVITLLDVLGRNVDPVVMLGEGGRCRSSGTAWRGRC
jgi:hypothetical protein